MQMAGRFLGWASLVIVQHKHEGVPELLPVCRDLMALSPWGPPLGYTSHTAHFPFGKLTGENTFPHSEEGTQEHISKH
jgi:hypothetical protein